MVNVLGKRFRQTTWLGVVDVVLLTHLLYNLTNVRKMAVVDAGKQVMFNLKIKASGEKECEPSAKSLAHERVRSHNLVLVEVAIRDINALMCQVVHLGWGHETERYDPDWNGRETEGFESIKDEKLPHVTQEENQHASSPMLSNPCVWVSRQCNCSVIPSWNHQLDGFQEVHCKRADEPNWQPCLMLMLV